VAMLVIQRLEVVQIDEQQGAVTLVAQIGGLQWCKRSSSRRRLGDWSVGRRTPALDFLIRLATQGLLFDDSARRAR